LSMTGVPISSVSAREGIAITIFDVGKIFRAIQHGGYRRSSLLCRLGSGSWLGRPILAANNILQIPTALPFFL